jgi:AraC family transcriptional regulator of adaptative response/methylated-DNA-[protein]-cysteine methyltransferase
MAAACRQIESAETPPSLATLARSAGLSPYHFHRLFTAIVGITPKTYALAERQKRVRRALAGTKRVTDAIFDAGFGSGSRFYADSSKVLGMTATRFKNGGMDTGIRFAIRRCLLGHVLVAMSNKGVCAILLGNAPETLVHEIRDLFPNATFEGRDKNFERMMSKVVAHVDAGRGGLDVPLDVQGTAFQHKVWRALTQIPAGKTVTYSDLAAHLGAPKAVRAVASACAANKLAIVIPCHRVVRSDGTLSGYRWGVERKRKLLERERNALPSNKSR